jgi:hypothetical protein
MGGARIQLGARGLNDNEIMGNPEVTFFKSVFKRHTNFSIESKKIEPSSDNIDFSSIGKRFKITTVHDLLSNLYVEIGVSGQGSDGKYSVNHFGNSLIKEAKLIIGGHTIETLDAQWLQIYHELNASNTANVPDYYFSSKSNTSTGGKNTTFNFVSDNTAVRTPLTLPNRINGNLPLVFGGNNHDGNTAGSTTYYKKIFVQLPFFFTKNIGLALPLVALYNSQIEIEITLETKANLIGTLNELDLVSFDLYGDFVLLEESERNRFRINTLSYLIEIVKKITKMTPLNTEPNNFETVEDFYELGFTLSVKYICWVAINSGTGKGQGPCYFVSLCDNNENGNDGYYGKGSIILEGGTKQGERCMSYYTRYLPQKYCKYNIPDLDRIGLYSFAVSPFDHQPSGSCNFSRLLDKRCIKLKFANNTLSTIVNKPLHFYAVNYNIYQINGGIGGLKYQQ